MKHLTIILTILLAACQPQPVVTKLPDHPDVTRDVICRLDLLRQSAEDQLRQAKADALIDDAAARGKKFEAEAEAKRRKTQEEFFKRLEELK